ncbi:MAG: GNAT family N-acetyltransferase, partial [Oscillospiraceae bacterium]|nr:GNAT family N-acetyltransferase [Oscillospiraceae bacterium]
MVTEVTERKEKSRIARRILEALTDWFGIAESREKYIMDSEDLQMFASFDEEGEADGFICLKETGKDTAEIAVIGVLREHHRQGIGSELFQ